MSKNRWKVPSITLCFLPVLCRLCCSWYSVVVLCSSTIHSKHIHSDQCDRKPQGASHVSGRSSPAVVQWFQSLCVVYVNETPRDTQNEFDSKTPDTPDRTWQLCIFFQYRRHTEHLQLQQEPYFEVESSNELFKVCLIRDQTKLCGKVILLD